MNLARISSKLKFDHRFENRSIVKKISALVTAMVVFSTASVGILTYRNFNQALLEKELSVLRKSTRVSGQQFSSHIDMLLKDVTFLSGIPPIQGIIRARRNRGLDPMEHSSQEVWQSRLAAIFTEILRAKPQYLSVAYIGAASGGREIVRVVNEGSRIVRTAQAQLQPRGESKFFQEAIGLADKRFYISDIDLSGQQEGSVNPHVPVLRAAQPVRTPEGEPFGIVTIQQDMRLALREQRKWAVRGTLPYIVNDRGGFLLHPDPKISFASALRGRAQPAALPDFRSLADRNKLDRTAIETTPDGVRMVVSMHKVFFDPFQPGRYLIFAQATPWETVIAASASTRRQNLIIGGVLLALALGLGVMLARSMTLPLRRVTKALIAFGAGETNVRLPTDASDETGTLARAFVGMTKLVGERAAALEAEVTQRKEAEQALQHAAQELQASNRELDDFAYIVSHDLKEPLRGIQTYSSFLREAHGGDLGKEGLGKLETIGRLARRLQALIDSLLYYSRVGRLDLAVEETDLNQVLEEILESLGPMQQERGADIRIPRRLPTLECDQVRIGEVFRNLITNALKYNDKPDPWIEIGFTAGQNDRSANGKRPPSGFGGAFYVRDNGIGIRERHTERIFQIFKRLHGRDKYGGGTGAGLSIANKIVQRHGGRLWVESEYGQGSSFYFTLPGGEA